MTFGAGLAGTVPPTDTTVYTKRIFRTAGKYTDSVYLSGKSLYLSAYDPQLCARMSMHTVHFFCTYSGVHGTKNPVIFFRDETFPGWVPHNWSER